MVIDDHNLHLHHHHHHHQQPPQRTRKRKRASSWYSSSSSSASSPNHFFQFFCPFPPVPSGGKGNRQLNSPAVDPYSGVVFSWLIPMMETEMQLMEMRRSGRREIVEEEGDGEQDHSGYTSLKDIIPSYHSGGSGLLFDGHAGAGGRGFSSANITIKNQLVKHAASMYLQSTAMLARRNRSCFPRSFWARAVCRNPAFTCLSAVTGPICSFLQTVATQIAGICSTCRSLLV